MNDLLAWAVDAHGGLQRWNEFRKLKAALSIDGAIWHLKRVPGLLQDKVVDMSTHEQRITIEPFDGREGRVGFENERMTFESAGRVSKVVDSPASTFAGQTLETPWDLVHVAYFASEALWTYLTSPFLYTYPGFITREIEPWHEDGEIWRRLEVTFPDNVASHTKTQITHFGPDGLMRRHDYTVDILGGATGANYPGGYRSFQGIMVPTTRRIFAYDADLKKVPEPILVSIDISDVSLR
jgi:hypothetical protein